MDDFVIVELRGPDDGTLEELLATEGLRVGPTRFVHICKALDAEQVAYPFVAFGTSLAANLATPAIKSAAERAIAVLRERTRDTRARVVDDPPFNPEDIRPGPESWRGSE